MLGEFVVNSGNKGQHSIVCCLHIIVENVHVPPNLIHDTVCIPCSRREKNTFASFYVTDTPGPTIIFSFRFPLSWSCCRSTFLPRKRPLTPAKSVSGEQTINCKGDLIDQYPECLDGIGQFQGARVPYGPWPQHSSGGPPSRTCAVSFIEGIKRELDEMVPNNITAKIEEGEFTQWVNSLVYRPTEIWDFVWIQRISTQPLGERIAPLRP